MLLLRNNRNSVIEAVAWRCSVKKVFLEISKNSQENTYGREFLAIENPLKMMKNTSYIISDALVVLNIFNFFS